MYLFFLPCKPASGDLSSWYRGKLWASAGRVAGLFQEVTPVDPSRNGQVAHGFQVFIELVYDFVGIGFGYPHDLRNLCHCDECLFLNGSLLLLFLGYPGLIRVNPVYFFSPFLPLLSPEIPGPFHHLHYTKQLCLRQ